MNDIVPVENYEEEYIRLLEKIMRHGTYKQTRNGGTTSIFGASFSLSMRNSTVFPVLHGRQMYLKGILGEFAAMLRGPKTEADFKKYGCNYWKQWTKSDGSINVDYGNAWIDFNGVNQLAEVAKTLKTNPNDRRIIVSGWRPDRLAELDLPCCHMLYQWRTDGKYLDMIWYQRSVDSMVGLPSDVVLAAVWNIMLANECGFIPGNLHFMLGDTHIYEAHNEAYDKYINNYYSLKKKPQAHFFLKAPLGQPLQKFEPEDLNIIYNGGPKVQLDVLA